MTDHVNIRALILDTMLEVTKQEEYSHIAIRNTLEKYQYLPRQERKFYKRVCEGTLENLILIDHVIQTYSGKSINKIKPVIRNILRAAVYELYYMDSVPVSATCNEAVKLAEKRGFRNLKGFVNGMLRNIARKSKEVEYPNLSIRYSMPEWIINLWSQTYDTKDLENILKSFFMKCGTSIRVNTDQISVSKLKEELEKENITVTENEMVPYGLFISNYDAIHKIKAFQSGLFYVQDTSSMLVVEYAGIKDGDHVIDVCAAPGGKSLHIAEILKGSGVVEARDLTPYKVELMKENIKRLGLNNITADMMDARMLDERSVEKADVVIADLPCSGLGVIGKKPDIKYKMTEEKQKDLILLQREILHTVQSYVKPGGILMYSTCTININENESNVAWFLKEHSQFSLDKQVQLLPDKGKNDGFFIARLVKNSGKAE